MNFSAAFLAHIRQYAKLESQLNRDFSAPIRQLAHMEVDRLMTEGFTEEEAVEAINGVLSREVKRFPVSIDIIPF